MSKKIRWITETAIMLALLVALQALTKGFGQFVTGSFVNAVLAVAVLVGGFGCGITVALISPVLAFLLGIAPQIITVPAIMVANAAFVTVLHLLTDKGFVGKIVAWLLAALIKFGTLYAIVVWLMCDVFSQALLSAGTLKAPMLQVLTANFSWPQLVTALIGGGAALLMAPILKKALHK